MDYKEDVSRLNALISERMAEDVIFIADQILEWNSLGFNHFLKYSMDSDRIAIVGT